MQGRDGEVVPGGRGSSGQHGSKEVGKGSIETGVFMSLQEFSIKPGVTHGFIMAQVVGCLFYFIGGNRGGGGLPSIGKGFRGGGSIKGGQKISVMLM